MKVSILALALMTLTTAAQASWYQGYCSNAEGTVKSANGHNANYTQLTKREWNGGNKTETVIRDQEGTLTVVTMGEVIKEADESHTSCSKGGMGVWNGRTVTVSKVKITRGDGSLFDKNIVGVSRDLKSVETELLCEQSMNSMMPCESK